VHAVILNDENKILQLKQTYTDKRWGLPGGAVEPGETINETIVRECKEEIGVDIQVVSLTGFYYHKKFNAQVGIFLCKINSEDDIVLSEEHSEYNWFELSDLTEIQQLRVGDAINYDGVVKARSFN